MQQCGVTHAKMIIMQEPSAGLQKTGKQRERSARNDTSSRPNTLQQLQPPVTRGSLGIDLAAAVDVTLLESSVHTIPTGITGPVYHAKDSALGALLIGQASSGVAGLIVIPGVINADSTSEIVVYAFTLTPPLTITKGTQMAQLILYQKCPVDNDIFRHIPRREARGVGSKGNMVMSLVQKLQQQPVTPVWLRCKQQQCTVHVMADTGADVTIIRE